MKPSPSAPLTKEDEDIWCFVALERPWVSNFVLEDCSAQQDRRDAELMSWAQREGRWIRTQYGVSHYGGPLGLWNIDLGGETLGKVPAAGNIM
jgi:hypothetical protein